MIRNTSTNTNLFEQQEKDILKRLEALRDRRPENQNPFEDFDLTKNEDSTSVVISSFKEIFLGLIPKLSFISLIGIYVQKVNFVE